MTVTAEALRARLRTTDSPTGPAVPALLAAMTIWGATYVVTKFALVDVGPITVLLSRVVIASLVMAPFARRQGFRLRMGFERRFIVLGVTGLVLHLGFEIVGLKFTSASSAALIIATAPAITAAFSVVLLGERLTRLQSIGIALSIVGVSAVTGARIEGGSDLAWLGNLLVMAGVVTWGVYTVQGRRMAGSETPWLVATTASMLAAAWMLFPVAVGEIAIGGVPTLHASSIAAILYLGLGASAMSYALWNLALNHVGGSVAGPYINLVPLIGVVLAVAVGERMTAMQIVGGTIVAGGVWLSHVGSRPAPAPAPRSCRA